MRGDERPVAGDHRRARASWSCAGAPFTAWKDDATELWVSDGSGTERVAVPAVDAYRLMVEEVSSALRGGPGWVLPLERVPGDRRGCSTPAAPRSAAAGARRP